MSSTATTATTATDRAALPAAGTWAIDPTHTSIEAVARHLVVSKVRGRFTEFSGTVTVGEDVTDSAIDIAISAASIDTGTPDRNAHLRSADFLDVETHPDITFRSTSVEPAGNRWHVPGELTIRGATRPVTLDVTYLGTTTDPWGNPKAAFEATAELDREAFGMTWNQALETGGVLVSKTLKVELAVQLAPAS
jgi:polyisoprenoid-binding protein YceI